MRVMLPLLAVVVVAPRPMSGQAAGDSVRLRIRPSSAWTYGRVVSLDSGQLTVTQADGNQPYPLPSIGRLEVRRRKNPLATIVGSTVACAAGAALAALVRPDDRRPLFGSDRANIEVAAGVGLAVGLIELSVSPWHWKRLRVGVTLPSTDTHD